MAVAASTLKFITLQAATTPTESGSEEFRSSRLRRAKVNATAGGRDESAQQAGKRVTALGTDEATGDVADETQPGKQQYEEPELAGPDASKRTVRARRQQRKDDNCHHREADAGSQTGVVDAGD